ncbi:16S rRNA (guanine(527)-N(7))-methyltransferase RsmG [Paenibacillus tarimensis]
MEWFIKLMAEQQRELSNTQLEQLERYYQILVEWNEKMNLTGITERDAVYEKHFYDSISLSFYVDMDQATRLADIGSGAGFPSVPLKICYPHLHITIVDSLNKRIQFLTHLCEKLGLKNCQLVHGRAEDIARQAEHRDQYDLVTARAVARLNVLNEFCLPFARPRALFAAMKGSDPKDEVHEAGKSLKELGGKLENVHHFKLPNEESDRHIILIRKQGSTPKKYPRKAGTPLKQPIV